jgi:capsule polysaccharide export protein KpsE/RkpR
LNTLQDKPSATPRADFDISPDSTPTSGSSFFLRVVLNLYHQPRRVIRTALFTAALSSGVVLLIPNRYESTAKLIPGPSNSTSMAGAAAKLGLGGGLSDMASSALKGTGSVYVPMLGSRTIQDEIIDKFDLRKVYNVRYYLQARARLVRNTSIAEDKQTSVITLTVQDSDPRRAAQIAQMYIDSLNRIAADLNTSSAHRERVFIEDQLKTVRADLDTAAGDLSAFSTANVALDVKEQGRAMVQGAATLEGQLIAAQSELKGLEQIYGSENERVLASKARIKELQHQKDKLAGTGDGDIYPGFKTLPDLGVKYANYARVLQTKETVYALLTQQYEMAKIEEAKELPSVRVLDQPEVPEKKVFPPRTIIVLFATLLSIILTPLLFVLLEDWRKTDPSGPSRVLADETIQFLHESRLYLAQSFGRKRPTSAASDDHRAAASSILP